MKTCRKCNETKPLSEFYERKSAPDGREYVCKDCRRRRCRERKNGSEYVDPAPERAYTPRLSGRPWQVVHSPGEWPIGSRITTIDVKETLKRNYFDLGMRIYNVKTEIEYTVSLVDNRQVLKNGRSYLRVYGGNLEKVKA